MAVWDAITNALSGKPPPSAPAAPPAKAQGDFDDDMRIRANNMRAMGLNPDGSRMAPSPAPLPTMHDHADALHPVPKKK